MGQNTASAQPFEDFIPIQNIITFPHGETFKTVRIDLAKPNPIEEEGNTKKVDDDDEVEEKHDSEDAESEEENQDIYFNIKLSDPKPEGAKISGNKASCKVIISQSEDFNEQQEMQQRLLEIYLAEKSPNWGK